MTNNNLANIATFEQLQAGQNARSGVTQMSVFNNNKNKNTAIANVDTRELITLLGYVDNLEDDSTNYTKLITAKNIKGAETIQTSAKIRLDKAVKKLNELENEIKQDQKQIQSAKNRLETAKRTLKL
ncbi:MAG: hypothetical protein LBP87_07690 [Planctomycetaceae bacterium]|jgi:hypothetical protein|nr:hypothetical protein [Planctomycetaceae bacterium]